MDIKRALTTGAIFLLVFIGVQYFASQWEGKKAQEAAAATQVATQSASYVPASEHPAAMEEGANLTPIVLGNAGKDSKDKLAITIDPITAGINLVQLNVNDYAETIADKKPLSLLEATPGLPKPYATLGVHVTIGNSAEELPLGIGDFGKQTSDPAVAKIRADKIHKANATALYDLQYAWKCTKISGTEVDCLLTINGDNAKPLLQITKIFQIDPNSYNVTISHQIKNLSGLPLHVAIDEMAATDLSGKESRPPLDDRFYHAAALSSTKNIIEPDQFNATHAELYKIKDTSKDIGQFNDYAKDPFVWVASSNRFFVAITRPLPQNPTAVHNLIDGRPIPMPQHVADATIDVLRHAATSNDSLYGIRLTGTAVEVPAHAATDLPLTVYFGPKKRDILDGRASAPVGSYPYEFDILQYVKVIQFSRGSCFLYTFCTFNWLALAILWLLDVLAHTVAFHNYGVAIIILVVAIRAVLHPLTRASQINMATMAKKMNVIKPLLDASKKRYADDKKKQQEEQMRIYRENHVNPAGGIMGCLPMLIQMPIWIAVYDGLWVDLDLRHAVFIPGWINDLASPDAILHFHPVTIPLISSMLGPIDSLNLLPLLLAVVFFFQMKVQMALQPKATDPQQKQMQNMSKYMFFVVPLFLYTAPAGLNLYYFASTMAGLVDTYIVRKTLKKRGILPASAGSLLDKDEGEDD